MDILRFKKEIHNHYDDFYYPTEFNYSSYKKFEGNNKNVYINKFVSHLLKYANSLLDKGEVFFQISSDRDINQLKNNKSLYKKIGVCFYNFNNVYQLFILFRYIKRYLAKNSLLIIHNANNIEVRKVCENILNKEHEFNLLYDLPTPYANYHTWGNGIMVVGYTGGDSHENSKSRSRTW